MLSYKYILGTYSCALARIAVDIWNAAMLDAKKCNTIILHPLWFTVKVLLLKDGRLFERLELHG